MSNSSGRRGSSSTGCACKYLGLCFKIISKLLKEMILEMWLGEEINN